MPTGLADAEGRLVRLPAGGSDSGTTGAVAMPVAGIAGIGLPTCECAAGPVANALGRRGVPPAVALTFLLAYLFFNDGIQTVIASASTFGVEELGFETGTVLAT